MRIFNFEIDSENDVIVVNALINYKYEFRLVLDTAATHSTIDSNVLYFSGYELKNSFGEEEVETSNGIIIVEKYRLQVFESISIVKRNFNVQVYDFLAHGITSDYDGVIGLDFLKENKICIDFLKKEILIS